MSDKKIHPAEKQFILDSMNFSFSSVTAYENCPRMFRYTYLDPEKERQPNAFSDFGSFCHSLLEQYYKGETDIFSLPSLYREGYDENVTSPFPYSKNNTMPENYYKAGETYFETFEDPWSKYTVLGVEQKFTRKVGGVPFVGVIDLILQDPTSGEIYVVDHKSKSKFKNKEELHDYLRQLYLYSLYVKDTYGKFPAKLIFNMFKIGEIVENPFEENRLHAAEGWFQTTVEQIYKDNTYKPKPQATDAKGNPAKFDFFCENICSVRQYCPRSSACYKYKGGLNAK